MILLYLIKEQWMHLMAHAMYCAPKYVPPVKLSECHICPMTTLPFFALTNS